MYTCERVIGYMLSVHEGPSYRRGKRDTDITRADGFFRCAANLAGKWQERGETGRAIGVSSAATSDAIDRSRLSVI